MHAEASVDAAQHRGRTHRVAYALVAAGLAACTAVMAVQAHAERVSGLSAVLAVAAVATGLIVVPSVGRADISALFIVAMLAAALLGPVSAAACIVLAEPITARLKHSSRAATAVNLLAAIGPVLVAGNLIRALVPHPASDVQFYAVVAGASAVYITLDFIIVSLGMRSFRGDRTLTPGVFWRYTPTQALNIGLALAGAGIYLRVGLPGIVFALLALFSFSYMAHLLEQSRRRAEQYVSLSWGVLAGLMRSLDTRDQRAARHAAAVARFARDMAAQIGMNAQEQELAHTAGLLHDIGHFALSDRVAERGRTLTDEDWEAIYQHPELGADMLKDLGMYGPVAEIVLAHHERLDGRGYPHGLEAQEIPPIARLISVAEVYDTLTARDTYRTRMSSFEALNELRRVAGTQLDPDYVEVLAELLTGEGVDYRHADEADFDTELDMERRINEARAG